MKPVNLKVAYHSPCHLIKAGGFAHPQPALGFRTGALQLDSNCGIAGTYGFKKEIQTSQAIGDSLFRQIEASGRLCYYRLRDLQVQIRDEYLQKVLHPLNNCHGAGMI